MPAQQQWSFTREDARRITQPLLAVIGAKSRESDPTQVERQALLLSWVANAEPFVLPNATHMLQVENSRGMAEGLAEFYGRHPLSGSR
jgi:pimeloyl-ACP methyl ester carboxylesterase